MKYTTRFSPTSNGNLHLGHVYSLLVNERLAHSNNGTFVVRFDDDSPPAMALPEKQRNRIVTSQWEDIKWLDLLVDEWQWQSKLHKDVLANLELIGHEYMKDTEEDYHILPVHVRMLGTGWLPYPYVPQQTAERVMMDHMIGTTHIIRGEEFFSEFSLYSYFCEKFNFKIPKFIFLPRLMGKNGDISKTNGGYSLAEFRGEGYSANDVKDLIAKAVLYYPTNGWELYNLRSNPRINL